MSDEYVEVPVTRRARVTLVGALTCNRNSIAKNGFAQNHLRPLLGPGDLFVVRPAQDAPFRSGFIRYTSDDRLDVTAVPAACDGDLVYRVEPA